MSMSDAELLAALAAKRDAELFRQLTQRHIDFVYAAAVRQSGDRTAAQDITQAVFLLLWQRVGKLKTGTVIKGWLFNATRYVAANARRAEARRTMHEREAAVMRSETTQRATEISPVLDDAMAKLSESDRRAVLLRYFEDQSADEVGAQLGVSADAAKKRISRATERLRQHLGDVGANVGLTALPAILASHAGMSSPVFLVNATMSVILSGTAGAAGGPATLLAKGASKMMLRNQIKILVIKGVVLTMCVGAAAAVVTQEVHPPAAAPAPVVVAQAQPAEQPPAQPATVAAPQTEDPEYQGVRGVLTGIVDAYDKDDNAKMMSLLYADPVTGKQILSELAIIFPDDMAAYRVEKMAIKHFGSPGMSLILRVSTVSALALDILARTGPDDVSITGDTAVLTPSVDLPGNWPNKPIYFRKVGEIWKVDVEQTFRLKFHLTLRHGEGQTETEDQLLADAGKQLTEKLNAIADRIERGEIQDVYQTQAAIDQMYLEASQEFRSMDVNILPK
jgi:RNA polymerase sigma factor (sigma-70 family)